MQITSVYSALWEYSCSAEFGASSYHHRVPWLLAGISSSLAVALVASVPCCLLASLTTLCSLPQGLLLRAAHDKPTYFIRARNWEELGRQRELKQHGSQVFYYQISEVISHCFCPVLLIQQKMPSPTHPPVLGITQRGDYQELGITGGSFRELPTWRRMNGDETGKSSWSSCMTFPTDENQWRFLSRGGTQSEMKGRKTTLAAVWTLIAYGAWVILWFIRKDMYLVFWFLAQRS